MIEELKLFHDSHSPYYRFPLGACKTDANLFLAVDVHTKLPVAVSLRLWQENVGERLYIMHSLPNAKEHYVTHINTPAIGCLLWYYFIIEYNGKRIFYGNNQEHLGGVGQRYEDPPDSFQITVYRADATTPAWFKHSIIYQIFPDRFYREGNQIIPKKNAVYHANWYDSPYYYKDEAADEIVAYDFFGGNLQGIIKKLSYLKDFGIGAIYLNPVFEAASNHRYDTGNYHQIDPILGTNNDFTALCAAAKKAGIHVIIDGVFSHTGSDSIYFNRYGSYSNIGAYQSPDSPYYNWYDFKHYPDSYTCWWNFDTLPDVTETTPSYMDFIIDNKDSVLHHWLKIGISGWRLDVIDELPQKFSRHFYKTMKESNPDSVLIGEVWEDASNKVSYGVSREYLCGYEMDSAMNYPFRNIVLDFLLGHANAEQTTQKLLSQRENYPAHNYYAMMNLLGSHDVERVITLLGQADDCEHMSQLQRANYRLDPKRYALGIARTKLAALWQMTFPGVPSIYYGDEIGMQGFRDPYNRAAYEWNSKNTALCDYCKQLAHLRNKYPALRTGKLTFLQQNDDLLVYLRSIVDEHDVFDEKADNDAFVIIINRSINKSLHLSLNLEKHCHSALFDVINEAEIPLLNNVLEIDIPAMTGKILRQKEQITAYPRDCGVLLHISSLCTPYGIGDFGESAYTFVDWLAKAGQHYWQILPLNPVGYGASPYQSSSVFAGNKLLISPDELVKAKLLKTNELYRLPINNNIDFVKVNAHKKTLLSIAFSRFTPTDDYNSFCSAQAFWLDDYARYIVLKNIYANLVWTKWPKSLKAHQKIALQNFDKTYLKEMNYIKFVQYIFFTQWLKLKQYANAHDIKLIGDMPIFPSHDSADVWANQALFNLAEDGMPLTVAGVPPDYFSKDGQLWGNPHYRWDVLAKDNYSWWIKRIQSLLHEVDIIRLDHFRGFAAYWAVDSKAKTARVGKWEKGPGLKFFQLLRKELGRLPLIAENLGIITPDVETLRQECCLPGMRVLQFSLEPDEEKDISFSCAENNIIYTGTHDNNTLIGWLEEECSEEERTILAAHFQIYPINSRAIADKLIEYAYAQQARTTILPMQDILHLDARARMNTPGTIGNNWQWRMPINALSEVSATNLANLVQKYNR